MIIPAVTVAAIVGLVWAWHFPSVKLMRAVNVPDKAENLRKLRRARGHASVKAAVRRLNAEGTALVLGGGGGKGAYQVGCLLALRSVGVRRFAAFAGTSVGALNAVLVGQRSLLRALRIWRAISFRRVLRAHPIGFVAAVLARMVLAPMFVIRATFLSTLADTYKTLRLLGSSPFRAALAGGGAALSPMFWLGATNGIGLTLATSGQPGVDRLMRFVFFLVAFNVLVMSVWAILSRWHNVIAERLALFSNEPLLEMLRASIRPTLVRRSGSSIFVTMSADGWLLKPFAPQTSGMGVPVDPHERQPHYTLQFLPIYEDVVTLGDAEMIQRFLQSAALPEVFPRRVIGDRPTVDGGLADNLPLLPVLRQPAVRTALTIALDHRELKATAATERRRLAALEDRLGRWVPVEIGKVRVLEEARAYDESRRKGIEQALQRSDELKRSGLSFSEIGEILTLEDRRTRAAAPEPPPYGKHLVRLAPSRRLGNLFGGTMNFSSRYARSLIRLGFWDTLDALEKGEALFEPI